MPLRRTVPSVAPGARQTRGGHHVHYSGSDQDKEHCPAAHHFLSRGELITDEVNVMKKYRIGLVGFAHMHVLDQIKPFLSMPERVEWIGASDIKPMVESEYFESSSRSMNLKLCQEQCGFTRVFEDYRDLLDLKPDLVLVNCENAFHGIIIPEILMRGIHVVVEKPLAYSTEHAMAIARVPGSVRRTAWSIGRPHGRPASAWARSLSAKALWERCTVSSSATRIPWVRSLTARS